MKLTNHDDLPAHVPTSSDQVVDLMADAETITVPSVDQVRALPGPDLALHLAEYYHQLAAEQLALHVAEGESASRPHAARAAELEPLTAVPLSRLSALQAKADASTSQVTGMLAALAPFRTRPRGAVPRYYLFLVLLIGGDLAGMTGALVALGEVPWIAAIQAMAVAAAAVVVGMLASEVKHVRDARRRVAAGAPGPAGHGERGSGRPAAAAAGVLFQPDGGESVVRWVLLAGLAAMLLIAGGVSALRSVTDGAGWIFGCFAAAVSLGSAANSYVHSDEVADLLDNLTGQHRRDDAELHGLDLGPVAERDREAALAVSLRDEWRVRGEAAAARVCGAGALALMHNPAVAGHGLRPTTAAAPMTDGAPHSNGTNGRGPTLVGRTS